MSALAKLQRTLAALPKGTVRKASSFREQCEERARAFFNAGVDVSELTQMDVSRLYDLCERIVRDYGTGRRSVHFWEVLALPKDAQVAICQLWVELLADGSWPPKKSPAPVDDEEGAA